MSLSKSDIITLHSIDSTNNYAMGLIDNDQARHGTAITAETQTGGKGQRGRAWMDTPGESLLMSLIVCPNYLLTEQFLFNANVTVAIANVLQKLTPNDIVRIKWPNDIIITDKKAGGILIENVIRGNKWSFSVIGLGINVFQHSFPDTLPYATSLNISMGITLPLTELAEAIRASVLGRLAKPYGNSQIMTDYNALLFKKGAMQSFTGNGKSWVATILEAMPNGTLLIQYEDGKTEYYTHGQVVWDYGNGVAK